MSDATIENPQPEFQDPADIPMGEKKLDKGFKRNMLIIAGAVVAAVAVIAVVILGVRSKITSSQSAVPATSMYGLSGVSGSKPSDLTPADAERLGRVQTLQSEAAQAAKETYIPKELPLNSDLRAPAASMDGPGSLGQRGYNDAASQQAVGDPVREANIKKGVEIQMAALLAKFEPPGTGSAGPYSPPAAANVSAGAQASANGSLNTSAASTAAQPAPEVLVRGLKFASSRLVSPLDTSKTEFISTEITSGPLQGAYLIGKGRLVNDSGVMLEFNRMSFDGEDYVVDVKALDNATSSDAVAADIDKKILARTVLPVLFTTAQAYLNAVAQPGATIVAGGFATQVVTPAAQGRQAAAAGLAAGVGRAGEGLANTKPSAYLPVNTPVSLLFNAPVLKKSNK